MVLHFPPHPKSPETLWTANLSSSIFPGVILPGQRLEFPVIFKSPNSGIFLETWLLQTGPVLDRGRPITVTLKGIAFEEDLNMNKRQQVEVGWGL